MIEVSPTFTYVQNYLLTIIITALKSQLKHSVFTLWIFMNTLHSKVLFCILFSQLIKLSPIAVACFLNISMITRAEEVHFRGTQGLLHLSENLIFKISLKSRRKKEIPEQFETHRVHSLNQNGSHKQSSRKRKKALIFKKL